MKKIIALILTVALFATLALALTSCGNDEKTIVVGASPTPHAEILAIAKDILAEEGYNLVIREYNDYILPNTALYDGDLDANYFQHLPYLESFNADNGTDIVSAGAIHYEPFGIYGNGVSSIENLPAGTTIFIPADDSNETRALFLLAQEGLITLKDGVTVAGGANHLESIKDNGGYEIVAVQADTVPAQLRQNEGAIAVINGNYAIGAGLKIADAFATEDKDGEAGLLYANIIAVNPEDKDSAKIKALVDALSSEKVKNYIKTTYNGAVVSSVGE
jgi:D-methionine transport system substrate-binding protein